MWAILASAALAIDQLQPEHLQLLGRRAPGEIALTGALFEHPKWNAALASERLGAFFTTDGAYARRDELVETLSSGGALAANCATLVGALDRHNLDAMQHLVPLAELGPDAIEIAVAVLADWQQPLAELATVAEQLLGKRTRKRPARPPCSPQARSAT